MATDPVSEEQRAWERTCSPAVTSDVLWKLDAYRAAHYLLYCARIDRRALGTSAEALHIRLQLTRAAGSVSANIGEGYSRWSKADRRRFLGYALSSTRECVSWYESSRDLVPDETVECRLQLVARLRALLLGLLRSLRNGPKDDGPKDDEP